MGVASEAATAVAENAVTGKKLRIKVLSTKPANGVLKGPQTPEVNCLKKVTVTDGRNNTETGLGNKHLIGACQLSRQVCKVNNSESLEKSFITHNSLDKSSITHNSLENSSITYNSLDKSSITHNFLEKSSITHNQVATTCNRKLKSVTGCKRRSEEVSGSHERKRLKMDRSTTIICQQILKRVMGHQLSPAFHNPVDTVAYDLKDYFDIIKKPMDLGTIKQKLLQRKYVDAEQFQADVKLTFSNAMLYNPPGNWCHEYARELNSYFDRLWKPVEIKFHREHRDLKQKGFENSSNKIADDKCLESISAHRDQFPGKVLPQKEVVSEDLKMRSVEGQHSDLKAIKVSLESISDRQNKLPAEVLPRKEKGFEGLNARQFKAMKKVETKPQPKSRDSLSSKSDLSGPVSQSSSSMPSEVKCENTSTKKTACDNIDVVKAKSTSALEKGSRDQGSEEKHHGFASFPATSGSFGATIKGLESVLDVELSPSRALRVAKMKDRFAGLIVKAQHHTLLEPGGGSDAVAWQQEKEILQTRQHEERAKIEAQIRAVQSAAHAKAESERKKQRQAEREAARIALQKVEQSVFVDNNLQILKDLEALIGSSLVFMCHDHRSHTNVCSQVMSDKLKSPLERLGLYIKEEYRVGDESDYACSNDEDFEEGEVI